MRFLTCSECEAPFSTTNTKQKRCQVCIDKGKETKGISLRKAIDDMCKSCIYDGSPGSGGTWRQQVEACTSYKCPLYPVRPVSKPTKVIESVEAEQ